MKSTFMNSGWTSAFQRKLQLVVALGLFLTSLSAEAQVSINTNGSAPHPSAMLEVNAANKGFLLPRVYFASRPASPATGLTIYQLDSDPGIYSFDGTNWNKMSLAAYDFWQPNSNDIYYTNGSVGIGTTSAEMNGLNVSHYFSAKGAVRGASQWSTYTYSEGYLGVPWPEYLGLPFSVANAGVLGVKPANGLNGAAVVGWNSDINNTENYGGLFIADPLNASATNYGVYAIAAKGSNNYAGYFKGRMQIEGHSGSSASGIDSTSTLLTINVNHSQTLDTRGISVNSFPAPGYGYGLYSIGGYKGVYGWGNGSDYSGWVYGVQGYASGTAGTRVGVYGSAAGGTYNWASYFVGSNYMSGDLRIGTTTAATGYLLSVNGKIACEEVLVQDMTAWPDYVFKPEYKLRTLEELEASIQENGHLPGIPSAAEVESKGLNIGEMQKSVVEKVEELTLYTIEQNKMLKELKNEIDQLRKENESLRNSLRK
jgi:hypothetical protein